MKISELYNSIVNKKSTGIIVIDGPTGSGKTKFLKSLQKNSSYNVQIVSDEKIVDLMVETIRRELPLSHIADMLSGDILCIEDIDFLSCKEATLTYLSSLINSMAENQLVICTGICVKEKMNDFIQTLHNAQWVYLQNELR